MPGLIIAGAVLLLGPLALALIVARQRARLRAMAEERGLAQMQFADDDDTLQSPAHGVARRRSVGWAIGELLARFGKPF